MKMQIRTAEERGRGDHGWLQARHSFSFADYYDPQWMGFRALRVLNDDRIGPGGGFGTHPHRDMEIITYILEGALRHRDSMGHTQILRPGEFQYMSSGTGVTHSEFNASDRETLHLLQIWVLPERKGLEPRYAERKPDGAATGQFQLIASRDGREGSFDIRQDLNLSLGRFVAGERAEYSLAPGRYAYVHVAEGGVALNEFPLRAGDAALIAEATRLQVSAQHAAQVLLFDLN